MKATSSIHELLRTARVPHLVVPQRPAFTAQEEAAATHVPGRDWAKVVVCIVDGEPIDAVLPAPMAVNLDRLLELARGGEIRLAQEEELRRLCPDCEPTALPPFGSFCGQSVFVDVALAAEIEVVFNAGPQTEAIRVRWADFAASVRPIVGRFAEPPHDHVGVHRLSYRE